MIASPIWFMVREAALLIRLIRAGRRILGKQEKTAYGAAPWPGQPWARASRSATGAGSVTAGANGS